MFTIIIGAGNYGVWLKKRFCDDGNVLFYDNDRRKWGKKLDGAKIATLDELLHCIKSDSKIIVGGHNASLIHFIKDIIPPCPVYKECDGELVEVDMDEVDEFPYENSKEIGERNLEKNMIRMGEFKRSGREKAFQHAFEYISYKRNHIDLPEISSIELTNNCNLKCPNCPNSTLDFHKGFMSEEVFDMALKYVPPYKDDTVAVHCMGEPLLHPMVFLYLRKLAEIGANICMSTNGLLLNKNNGKEILSIFSGLDKTVLYISFHTRKSVESWYNFCELYDRCAKKQNIHFYGQVLEHNKKEAYEWLKEIGIDNPVEHQYIRHITSHSWGGNVVGRRKEYRDIEVNNRIRNCYYLRQRKIAVMWDGSLRGCCYDANATQKCGSIFDFDNSNINPMGYELCRCCDPDWITGYQ